jgi:hypothetical protein
VIEESGRWARNFEGRIFRRPLSIPDCVRQASTRIGKPIRFRARDWNDFLDWAGSCCCVAAISAFVTRGGGDADASNKTTTKIGYARNRMPHAPESRRDPSDLELSSDGPMIKLLEIIRQTRNPDNPRSAKAEVILDRSSWQH